MAARLLGPFPNITTLHVWCNNQKKKKKKAAINFLLSCYWDWNSVWPMEALWVSGLIFSVWDGSTWTPWPIRLEGPNKPCLSNGNDKFKKAIKLSQQHLRFTWTSSSFPFCGNFICHSTCWNKATSSVRPSLHRGFLKCLGFGSLMVQLSCPKLSTVLSKQHQLCRPQNGHGHFAQWA